MQKTIKDTVTLIKDKIKDEDRLLEAAELFDIDIDLSSSFIQQLIEFSKKFWRLIDDSDDSEFYIDLLSNF